MITKLNFEDVYGKRCDTFIRFIFFKNISKTRKVKRLFGKGNVVRKSKPITFILDNNMNKVRHKLLGILAKKYVNGDHPEGCILDVIVTVSTILKKLDINYDEFVFMSKELLEKEEIKYLEVDNSFDRPALYVQSSGITAYANKKYLRADMERQREDIKFWAQLILPVLSFIIAAIALYLNIKTQKEINTVKESQKIEIPK